jgi:hypothetical protein
MKQLTGYRLVHPRKRGSVRQLLKRFRVPKLDESSSLSLVYANGGYDGSCSGLCTVNGTLCYHQNAVYIGSRVRLFVVLDISQEEAAFELAYHARKAELFQNENKYSYVDGKHFHRPHAKIDNDVRRANYALLAQEFPTHKASWQIKQGSGLAPYLHRHVIGYFEWGSHK